MFRSGNLLFAAALAASILSGCVKPTKGEDTTTGGLFNVVDLTGTAEEQYVSKSVWNIPQSVKYRFTACLEGSQAHERLFNQKFTVEKPKSTEVFPVQTNSTKGCFEWEETIPYNVYAGQSGWITLERDVVGTGVYSGRKRIQIAVNPWATGEHSREKEPVAYLAAGQQKITINNLYDSVHADAAFAGELQGAGKLIAQKVKVRAVPEGEDGKWVALLVEVECDPVVQTRKANGDIFYDPVKDGDFDMMMQVLASNVGAQMNQKVLLLGGDMHTTARVVNGHMKAEFKVRQERRANQSNLELVMELRPRGLNGHKTVMPFDGIFRFGPGTVITDADGSVANVCLENGDYCNYEKAVKAAKNYEDLVLQGYVRDNDRYIFSNLKLRFTQILPGETATRRTVVYTASTCITDIYGKPLANTPMTIKTVRHATGDEMEKDETHKDTDEFGCLSWNGYQFHFYYKPEQFVEKEVIIQKGQKPTSTLDPEAPQQAGYERHLKFYLNPWDDKFTFGWDVREFTPDFFQDILNKPKIPSRFFLSDYNYHTVRFLYEVDQYMELEVKKWVLMSIVPQVLRYSGIINARKMVEHLRDGIYLMKVGIEKDYLDPRDNSGWILKNTPQLVENLQNVNGHKIRPKHYITTNQVLVRVVDGVIVYPIELMMRDLRLMRVRSNMMIELQLVDERLVQAYHFFRKAGIQSTDLENKVNEYAAKLNATDGLPETRQQLGTNEPLPDLQATEQARTVFAQSPDMTAARLDLDARVKHVQEIIQVLLQQLTARFEQPGSIGLELDGLGQATGQPSAIPADTPITDNFELRQDQVEELKGVLKLNDFSTVSFPKKEEFKDNSLDIFVEKDAGIEKRSFVGPVIFLSNAYSDSVRPTDNLDEANCVPKKGKDAIGRLEDLEIKYEGTRQVQQVEAALFKNRSNNAYQYNKYFSSLHDLCSMQVDDLIEAEKSNNQIIEDQFRAESLKYNYVKLYNLDYVSLTNEPLEKVKDGCTTDVANCLTTTPEETLKVESLDDLINTRLEKGVQISNDNPENAVKFKRLRGIAFRTEKTHWDRPEYSSLFFSRSPDSRAALCNLTANKIAKGLIDQKLTTMDAGTIHEKVMDICSRDGNLVQDIKDKIDRTNGYTFLGGLNLNFNVGEGFSVGTSSGWSTGFELTDLVGGFAGLSGDKFSRGAASILKPVNLKYGTGLSSSEGTSISESTYLVGQIAGFQVRLDQYEKCATVRLTDKGVKELASYWGDNRMMRAVGMHTADFSDAKVMNTVTRGVFVCEGAMRTKNPPKDVSEGYFYFTQHFTEGDMLDQADLYNHPWLLALRGMRDFATFVEKVRVQENASLPNLLYHVTGTNDPRQKGWALEHLKGAYSGVMPTFPGFYTELGPDEPQIDAFALLQADNRQQLADDGNPYRLEHVDRDPLHEVNHQALLPENENRVKKPIPPINLDTIK